jgi:hypothetical protein
VLLVRPKGIAAFQRCYELARFDPRRKQPRNLDVGKDLLPPGGTLLLTKHGEPILKKGAH